MRTSRLFLYSLLLVPLAYSTAAADIISDKSDGWHTWQIDEPGVSSTMCCFTWVNGDARQDGCHLDGRSHGITGDSHCEDVSGTVQVYVKMKQGVPDEIRVLSSNCPVSAESDISNHGLISADENLGWFRDIIEDSDSSDDLREEALFGLVQSGGDAAFAYLDRLLTDS